MFTYKRTHTFIKIIDFKHPSLQDKLKQLAGKSSYTSIINYIHLTQYPERVNSFKTKSNKLKRLILDKTPTSKFKVPIVNLSSYNLSDTEERLYKSYEVRSNFF